MKILKAIFALQALGLLLTELGEFLRKIGSLKDPSNLGGSEEHLSDRVVQSQDSTNPHSEEVDENAWSSEVSVPPRQKDLFDPVDDG